MEESVTKQELERIAAVWGMSDPKGYVEQLVAEGFIPPARRLRGAPRVVWLYPPRTDWAVRSVLRFRHRGLRGDALRFAMWWSGRLPHSAQVGKFASSVYAAVPGLIESRLMDLAQTAAESRDLESIESRSEGDLSASDLIDSELERLIGQDGSAGLNAMLQSLTELASDVSDGELIEVIGQFVAYSLGIDRAVPRPTGSAIQDSDLGLKSAGDYTRMLRLIAEAPSELYDISRYQVRRNADHRGLIRGVAKWIPLINDKISDRQRDRLGPWRHPAVALRATMVGALVYYSFKRIGRAYRIIEEDLTGSLD